MMDRSLHRHASSVSVTDALSRSEKLHAAMLQSPQLSRKILRAQSMQGRANSFASVHDLPPQPRPRRSSSGTRETATDRLYKTEKFYMRSHYEHGGSGRGDYPLMGARSLERDHWSSRDRKNAREYVGTRETLVIELQGQVLELSKQCSLLQRSLDTNKEKLSSSMNSIKSFWSPELKKERQLRKEETARLMHQMHQLKEKEKENQHLIKEVCQLESELRGKEPSRLEPDSSVEASVKESNVLKQTMQEMELRIETQKQTLEAREASIRRLLGMLEGRGTQVSELELEHAQREDVLRQKLVEKEQLCHRLQRLLRVKETELNYLNQALLEKKTEQAGPELHYDVEKRHSADVLTLAAMIDSKDAHISNLLKHIATLEEESSHGGVTSSQQSTPGVTVSGEQESEVTRLKSRLEVAEKACTDYENTLTLFKDQLKAKEDKISQLQHDIDYLQNRVQTREAKVEEKSQLASSSQQRAETLALKCKQLTSKVTEQDTQLESLNRQVNTLTANVSEKDELLSSLRKDLKNIEESKGLSDSALSSVHDKLAQCEETIDKLQKQLDSELQSHSEETSKKEQELQELKADLSKAKQQIQTASTQVAQAQTSEAEAGSKNMQLRATVEKLQTELRQAEAKSAELESTRQQLTDTRQQLADMEKKVHDLHDQLKQSGEAQEWKEHAEINRLRTELQHRDEAMSQTQGEVDRLLDLLKTTETEKNQQDSTIQDLQQQIKELKQKISSLKKERWEEKSQADNQEKMDITTLRATLARRDDRVDELEEALRESVRITAQREMFVHELEMRVKSAETEKRRVGEELEREREQRVERGSEAQQLRERLLELGEQLNTLQRERGTQLQQLYSLKHDAVLATLTEKDAHIALLEMHPDVQSVPEVERLTQEKIMLQNKLKEITENQMKVQQNLTKLKKNSSSNSLVNFDELTPR